MDENQTNIITTVDEEALTEDTGEVVESPVKTAESAGAVSLSLENLIRGHLTTLTKLKSEIAEQNDTLNNVLANDSTYKEHDEAAKKAAKVKTGTKSEIMKRPEVMQVANKIKEAREEYKEQQATLSELLAEYQRTTGLDSIEIEDGKVKKIITTARLVS